jgi:hypothetical protein
MAEVFRMCDPDSQGGFRQLAAAVPLPDAQESLRKELAAARDRTARISSMLKQQTGKLPRSHGKKWIELSWSRITITPLILVPISTIRCSNSSQRIPILL